MSSERGMHAGEVRARAMLLDDEEHEAFLARWDRSEELGVWDGRAYVLRWSITFADCFDELLPNTSLAVLRDGEEIARYVDDLPPVSTIPGEVASVYMTLAELLAEWCGGPTSDPLGDIEDARQYPEPVWKECIEDGRRESPRRTIGGTPANVAPIARPTSPEERS